MNDDNLEIDNLTLFDILERDGRYAMLESMIDAGPDYWQREDFRKGVRAYRRGE